MILIIGSCFAELVRSRNKCAMTIFGAIKLLCHREFISIIRQECDEMKLFRHRVFIPIIQKEYKNIKIFCHRAPVARSLYRQNIIINK